MTARMPGPLAALLGAVLLFGVAWALLVPPFQAPDEQRHAAYVQSLATGAGLPGEGERPEVSTEQLAAQKAVNSDQTAANLAARTRWSPLAWERWERVDARLPEAARADGGGPNPAASNPPLYYLYDAVPYVAAPSDDLFARLTFMRLGSVLWLLVTVAGAWLLAGELFARDRLLQLVSAAVAGMLPMVVFVSAQIGPDTLLYALWSLALWLGVRLLRRGATLGTSVALLGVMGAAIVTKATAYALLPAGLFALGVGLWRVRGERRRALGTAAAALAALVLPVLAWVVIARASNHPIAAQASETTLATGTTGGAGGWRHLLSYLWQFYLPRLPFMDEARFTEDYPAFDIWVKQGWAAFGWLEVRFPGPTYLVFAGITAGVALAAGARLAAVRRRVDLSIVLFFALTAGALLAGLHWTDFHNVTSGAGPFMQGRYLFPLVPLAGVAVAQALTWLSGGRREVGAGIALGGLFGLQLFSLGLVATRFYA